MNEKMFFFIQYFFAFLSFGLILFFIGFATFKLLKHKTQSIFTETLRSVFLGYVLVITLFSLLVCGGITINIVFVLLLVAIFFEFQLTRKTFVPVEIQKPTDLKFQIGWLVFLLLLCFSWGFISTIPLNGNPAESAVNSDYILYSKIAKSIVSNGQENGFYYLNGMDTYYNGTDPYHYFDLWGAGLVAKLLNLNYYYSLKLIVYPLFYFIVLVGFVCLFKRVDTLSVLICFLLLFMSGIHLKFYDNVAFLNSLSNLNYSLLTPSISKLSFYYVFFVAAYLLYINDFKNEAFVCLLGLPVASIVTLPTIILALFSIIALLFLFQKEKRKTTLRLFIYLIIVPLIVIVFYSLFGRKSSNLAGIEITSPFQLILDSLFHSDFKIRRNIVVGSFLHLAILFAPFILLIFFFKKNHSWLKQNWILPAFVFFAISFSIFEWAFLYKELNSSQLFSNISIPLLNISVGISILNVVNSSILNLKLKAYLFLNIVLIFISVYLLFDKTIDTNYVHTESYIKEVKKTIEARSLKTGVSIKNKESLSSFHSKYNAVYPLGDYIEMISKKVVVVVNVGDFNTPIDSTNAMNLDRSLKAIKDGFFYRFVMKKYDHWPNENEVSLALTEFTDAIHADFLILSKNTPVPQQFKNKIDTIIYDEVSGERFVSLLH